MKPKLTQSRKYLANLKPADRRSLAAKVKCHEQYLYQLGRYPHIIPSRVLTYRLEQAARGEIKAFDFEQEARKKAM